MKSKVIVPTTLERELAENEYIVSTTDPSGRITSVNDVLVTFSGYSRQELEGAQHNIIRHPDMPRALFWLAWDTLQSGEGFLGYIKNLGKDGSFYWVFAQMTNECNRDAEIIGYRSVRRRPARTAIPAITDLYAKMRAAEQAAANRDAITAGLSVLRCHLGERKLSYEQLVATL